MAEERAFIFKMEITIPGSPIELLIILFISMQPAIIMEFTCIIFPTGTLKFIITVSTLPGAQPAAIPSITQEDRITLFC